MPIVSVTAWRIGCLLAAHTVVNAASASITTAPVFVFDWNTQHCPNYTVFNAACDPDILYNCDPDVVDSPAHAWRDTAGNITLLGPVDLGSRAMLGTDILSLRHDCHVYANSTNISTPAAYADREWIHSPWLFPNGSLIALTHMEDHDPVTMAARMSAITLFTSVDNGRTWQPAAPPPAHIVAVGPYQWNASDAQPFGFRSPSSILAGRGSLSGWYYATVTANWDNDFGAQPQGTCMMRTRDLTSPSSWLAWNGTDFAVSLALSPYVQPNLDPSAHACVPFSLITYVSLLWSSYYGRYMAFSTNNGNDGGGWTFQLSDDLINWDAPIDVITNGLIVPAGNGSVSMPTQAQMPGRFIARNDGSAAVYWEDPTATFKHSVGTCTPCPGINACTSVTRLPNPVFDALVTGAGFSCGYIANYTGYSHFYYPSLIDPASPSPNFDEVGATAQLLLVSEACAGADSNGNCSPFTPDGLLVRDVVRVNVSFS